MTKLSPESLEIAKIHIEKHGDTDIFPIPFEFDAIFRNWDVVKNFLQDKSIEEWQCLPYRRCLTPKSENGFRISTQLDPFETIFLTAATIEVGSQIEEYRRSNFNDNVFSSRFTTESAGDIYSAEWNWRAFDNRTYELAISGNFDYIINTDIADFFPRIYHHPLENALTKAIGYGAHLKLFKKLIKHWTYSISSGIPVGPSATRLFAELAIVDIDQALQNDGVVYLRYVDDIRIFSKSKKEALGILSRLATTLYENHSLTLSKHKTKIMTVHEYCADRSQLEQSVIEGLSQKIDAIVGEININLSPYDTFSELELNEEQMQQLSQINLKEMLLAELDKKDKHDPKIISYLLNRVKVFGDIELFTECINCIEFLYPQIRKIINFGVFLGKSNPDQSQAITDALYYLATESFVSQIPYQRMMALSAISQINGRIKSSKLLEIYRSSSEEFSKRELLLLFGNSDMFSWFKENKRGISSFEPWVKRAFIQAARCLPGDEFSHWGKSFKEGQSELEKILFK